MALMAPNVVRLPNFCCDLKCLAGLRLVVQGRRQRPVMKEDPAGEDALSDCSTSVPLTDSSDDETVSTNSTSPKRSAAAEGAAILFDWDDTLLPTSYIRHNLGDTQGAEDAEADVRAKLEAHGERIKDLLRSANKAAHVSIVTLSCRPWVTQSAARYFPGADISALLDELGIDVHYAGEYAAGLPAAPTQQPASLEHLAALKRTAMSRCLARADARLPKRKNVISVGDSVIEQQALKQLVPKLGRHTGDRQKPLCKIVKFMDGPSLEELTEQLVFLSPWLRAMVAQQTHFQLCINSTDDLTASALDFVTLLSRRMPPQR